MKTFETPEVDVLKFDVEDVVTSSSTEPMGDTPCTPLD